jgi:hypothetical protein
VEVAQDALVQEGLPEDMVDAATVLTNYGLGLADELVTAAQLEGIDLAVAATVIEKESAGRNIWGSDTHVTAGTYTPGGPVTQANYLAYRAAVQAGRIGRNGCGPAQCTSASYQNQADALGGCWDPVANMRSGFRGIQALINQYGVFGGFEHYNGSGPAAIAYANDSMARYAVWQQRLAGATEDDDLTPDQAQQLADLHAIVPVVQWLYGQFAGLAPDGSPAPFPTVPGWPTLPQGTNQHLSLLDFIRELNEQVNTLTSEVAQLRSGS